MISDKYMPNTNLDEVLSLNDKEFFENFSFIMHIALIKDANLYTYLIDKMYEICERDKETLEYIFEKVDNNLKVIDIIIKKENVLSPLLFGINFAEILKNETGDRFNFGEALSLGTVASAFISYKKNHLTKEEYYEIRDMFVPFYLPISVDLLDIDHMVDAFCQQCEQINYSFPMVLLKKLGKTTIDSSITKDDIKAAFEELNFDEAW